MDPGPLGTLGVGMPFALAAQLAHPEQARRDRVRRRLVRPERLRVRHRRALRPADHRRGRATTRAWGQMMRPQGAIYGWDRLQGTLLNYTRYDKVVEALGGHGEFVERPEQIRPALERAAASGKPALRERDHPPGPRVQGRHLRLADAGRRSASWSLALERAARERGRDRDRSARAASRRRWARSRSSTSRPPGLPERRGRRVLEFGAVLVDPGDARVTTLEGAGAAARRRCRARSQRSRASPTPTSPAAPRIEELAQADPRRRSQGRSLIAHNAEFERHFLARCVAAELARARYLDTQDLLAIAHPDAPDLRLETFTRVLLGGEERHRALSDALDTARVVRGSPAARRAARRADATRWRARALETLRAATRPGSRLRARRRAARGRPRASPAQFIAIPDERRAARAVRRRGDRRGARATRRAGAATSRAIACASEQIRMARAVRAPARRRRARCCSRAARASGKSLAYLAAAIPFAMERAAGGDARAGRRLDAHEAAPGPAAREGHPGGGRACSATRVCARSRSRGARTTCARGASSRCSPRGASRASSRRTALAYAALAACARTRSWGEVGALPAALLFRYPPLRDLLRRSVARARGALHARAVRGRAQRARFGRRRAALAQAHLVVANHDLLLRWPPDYPNFTFAIVDEAHELAGVADEAFAAEVRPAEVLERLDELFGRPADGREADALLPKGRRRGAERDARALAARRRSRIFARSAARSRPRAGELGDLQLPLHADEHLPGRRRARRAASAQRLESAAAAADELTPSEAEDSAARARRGARERRAARRRPTALRGAFAAASEAEVAAFEQLDAAVRPLAPGRAPGVAGASASTSASRERLEGLRLRVGEPVRRRRRIRGARRARARAARGPDAAARLDREPVPVCRAHARRRARAAPAISSRRRPRRSRISRACSAAARSASSPACAACATWPSCSASACAARASTCWRRAAPPTIPRRSSQRFTRSGGRAARRAHVLAGPRHPGPGAAGGGDREAAVRGADRAAQAPRGAHQAGAGTTPSSATRWARCCST